MKKPLISKQKVLASLIGLLAFGVTAQTAFGQDQLPQSYPILAQAGTAAAAETADGRALRAKGDELLTQGNQDEAIAAYRRAEELGAGDEALTMDIAQTYLDQGKERDAYWEYHKLRFSDDPDIRVAACEQLKYLKYEQTKKLPAPYFADLATYGGFQSIDSVSYIDAVARLGAVYGDTNPVEYYLFASAQADNRSGVVAGFPQTYFDNIAVAGVGVRKYLMDSIGLSAVAEAGWGHDLVNRDRDRDRFDYRGGLQLYNEWNTEYDCGSTNHFPNRFVFTAWAELMYYSRYSHSWIVSTDLRPGIRVYESPKSNVDVFALLAIGLDSEGSDDYEYGETGIGVSWTPDRQIDFKITAKASEIFTLHGDSDTGFGIEFEYFGRW